MDQLLHFIGFLIFVFLIAGLNGEQIRTTGSQSNARPTVQANRYPIPATNNKMYHAASWNQVRPPSGWQYMPTKPKAAPAMTKDKLPQRGVQQQQQPQQRLRGTEESTYTYGSPKKKIKRRYKAAKQAAAVAATTKTTATATNYMKPANTTAPSLVHTYKSKPRAMDENELPVSGPFRFSSGHFNDHPFGDGSRFTGDGGMFHFGGAGGEGFRRANLRPSPLGFFGGRESHINSNMFRSIENPMMEDNHVRTFASNPFHGFINGLGRFSRGLFGRSLGRSAGEPALPIDESPSFTTMETTARSSTIPQQLSKMSEKLSTKHGYYAKEYNSIDKPVVSQQIPKETALRNNEVELENPQHWSINKKYRSLKNQLASSQTNSYQHDANGIPTSW